MWALHLPGPRAGYQCVAWFHPPCCLSFEPEAFVFKAVQNIPVVFILSNHNELFMGPKAQTWFSPQTLSSFALFGVTLAPIPAFERSPRPGAGLAEGVWPGRPLGI